MTCFNKNIIIDKKNIGGDNPVYVIAEAGLNHNGELKTAKKLVQAAKDADADAIKFQTFKTENFIGKSNPYFDLFKNSELSYEEFGEVFDFAKSCGITFFSTPYSDEDVDFLHELCVPCFKIASSDIINMPLIQHVAKKKLPIILSTGASTINEIQEALGWIEYEGCKNIILLHSVVEYPTNPKNVNLLSMNTLEEKFKKTVGYSDNGDSTFVDLVAVSLGAKVVEKHFTLDKNMSGPDHSFSIVPDNLAALIKQIREIEKYRGDGVKIPKESELEIRNIARRVLTAKTSIRSGEIITKEKITIKRINGGIEPKYINMIIGRKVISDIEEDSPITWSEIL